KKNIYNDLGAWKKFLQFFSISIGIGFTTAGIIFFFAYNWADLHKFIKIGLIEGLIIITTAIVLFSKISLTLKNILLTGTSILVGVLIAVFGQIYQTGANAYDFFLGWTMFITLWVIISNFAPLWLIYLTLINTTLILYAQQVAHHWSEVFLSTLLFIINTTFLLISTVGIKTLFKKSSPNWFSNFIALASVSFSTIGITIGIFDKQQTSFFVLILFTTILYGIGINYGLKVRRGFYLAIIPLSIIIIISAFLINISSDAAMFFIICLFVIASVTFVIKNLIDLQKKWINE
ncbi:DUF2157 domain-containing protein, partial [Xanthovirga aplysinae]|uniref:DUF2157 domain-containing protein n=1 Tax=Xanthovirga aplysinae TaxID=2529853 RepID=UPI0012BD79E5